jgi:hypothetical protein
LVFPLAQDGKPNLLRLEQHASDIVVLRRIADENIQIAH